MPGSSCISRTPGPLPRTYTACVMSLSENSKTSKPSSGVMPAPSHWSGRGQQTREGPRDRLVRNVAVRANQRLAVDLAAAVEVVNRAALERVGTAGDLQL